MKKVLAFTFLAAAIFQSVGCGAASLQKESSRDEPSATGLFVGSVSGITSRDPFEIPRIEQPVFHGATLEVKSFGATGDGTTNDTQALNKAIAAAHDAGGGTVHFPAGKYMVASVQVQSNVKLLLDKGAVIEGAKTGYLPPEPNPFDAYQDFGHSHFHDAVLWGENVENFAIVGGTVNGGGVTQSSKVPESGGDKIVSIRKGKNLLFKDVLHQTSGHFAYLVNDCENITYDHVVIQKSRDAIDLMGCRNVQVFGCHFTGCSDDTLGIKSDYALGRRIGSENIYAWDDYFESGCNGVQFGSETAGDFKHVRVWNIRIGLAMKAGIGITCNDSAHIEDVKFRDFEITKAANPIYILITDRLRTGEPNVQAGSIKDVTIENVKITDMAAGRQGPIHPATISGLPGHSIENLTLRNVTIAYPGGGTASDAAVVPPYTKKYEPAALGPRPAAGLFIRHAKGLTLENVGVTLAKPDARPVVVAWDVDGLTLERVSASPVVSGSQMLSLKDVKNVKVKDCTGLQNSGD